MNTKIAGGVLLIVGTSIGGGMLALPIATAASGFFASTLLLFLCWVIMTFSAFLILEVNLWLPEGSNIISMARQTLGKPGEVTAWTSYILLLYALLAAYISGGSALFHDLSTPFSTPLPSWLNSLLFVGVFGFIVMRGIASVDYVNRLLMSIKFLVLFILIGFTIPYLEPLKILQNNPNFLMGAVTVMITSFGFATIIPSLRTYFNADVKKLRLAILIGSLIPLACYILWDLAILGTLPLEGDKGLLQMIKSGGSATDLTTSLSFYLQNSSITRFAHLFTAICVLTSFLGVSLCLSDFLADGLNIVKKGQGNVIIFGLTFIPSLLIVLFYPTIFIKALSYAGIFCVILLALLPGLMAWRGRYSKKFPKASYQVGGGKVALAMLIIASVAVMSVGIIQSGLIG